MKKEDLDASLREIRNQISISKDCLAQLEQEKAKTQKVYDEQKENSIRSGRA